MTAAPRTRAARVLLVALVLLSAGPVPSAAGGGGDAGDAGYGGGDGDGGDGPAVDVALDAVLDDLVAAARALDAGNASDAADLVDDARARFDDEVAPAGPANATAAADALDALADETDPVAFRTGLVRFEAEVLALAAADADALLADGDHTGALAWVRAARDRVEAPGRSLPFAGVEADLSNGTAPSPVRLRAAMDAAAAFRLHEEVSAAEVLHVAGVGNATPHLDRAGALWERVARGRAEAALPDPVFQALDANMTSLANRVASLGGGGGDSGDGETPLELRGVRGPLTAMAYHRSISALDEVAAGVEAALYFLHRTTRTDPEREEAALEGFVADAARHRRFLFLKGEGSTVALDRAVADLEAAVGEGRGQAAVDGAVADTADALRAMALLDYGLVLKVEFAAVRADRVHRLDVALLRPPLEGLSSYEADLAYDPSVVAVVDIRPLGFDGGFERVLDPGRALFGGSADPPFTGGAVVAQLHVTATGPPGAATALDVTELTVTTSAGEDARVFRVRDGQATVADIRTGGGGDGAGDREGGGPLGTPGPAGGAVVLVGVAAALLVAGFRRRGDRRRRGGLPRHRTRPRRRHGRS